MHAKNAKANGSWELSTRLKAAENNEKRVSQWTVASPSGYILNSS
jgi:hypothetical protein